jgi:hypothetical protein
VLGLLAVLPAPAADAPDLSQIDRRIAKEPRYVCKQPLYGLYVFGPQARTRVWAVLDKSRPDAAEYDILYFDRNANGDLTESAERIVGNPGQRGGMAFDVGAFTDPATGDTHTNLQITRETGRGGMVFLTLDWRGKHRQAGGYAEQSEPYTLFAATPKEAPVLWPGADGPLSFQRWMWEKLTIGAADDLRVFLGHQGHGRNTFMGLSQDFLPKNVKVLATVIYTDRDGKERRLRSELQDRC